MVTGRPLKDATQYCRLLGRFIYHTITRLELTYVVHILSQFMQSPKEDHTEAASQVLRYLKGIFLPSNNNLQILWVL